MQSKAGCKRATRRTDAPKLLNQEPIAAGNRACFRKNRRMGAAIWENIGPIRLPFAAVRCWPALEGSLPCLLTAALRQNKWGRTWRCALDMGGFAENARKRRETSPLWHSFQRYQCSCPNGTPSWRCFRKPLSLRGAAPFPPLCSAATNRMAAKGSKRQTMKKVPFRQIGQYAFEHGVCLKKCRLSLDFLLPFRYNPCSIEQGQRSGIVKVKPPEESCWMVQSSGAYLEARRGASGAE